MKSNWTNDDINDAVSRSLRETGIHRAYQSTVRQFLLAESDDWPVCCEADCNPCVNELSRAVERAREILGSI